MQASSDVGILEEFRIKFMESWEKLPNRVFFLVLLSVWILLFHFLGNSTRGYIRTDSLFSWLYQAYNAGDEHTGGEDSHGNLIPFLVLGLMFWKRKELLAVPLHTWWPALGIIGVALVTHLIGFAVQQTRISIIGFFLGVYGLTGLAWGPKWLVRSFFPFCLFAFAIPLGSLADTISFPLRVLVCRLVEFISHYILAIDLVREGTQLRNPVEHYQYEVAAACSGIRSLVATILLSIVYAFVAFSAWWKRGFVILMAIPFAVLGNLLRMLVIVIAAEIGGQEWGGYVHENAYFSLMPYIPAILGLFIMGRWLGEDEPKSKTTTPGSGNSTSVGESSNSGTGLPAAQIRTEVV
jgi:exosortase